MPIDPIVPGAFVTVRPDPDPLATYLTLQAPTSTMQVQGAHLQSLSQVVLNIANSTINTSVGGDYTASGLIRVRSQVQLDQLFYVGGQITGTIQLFGVLAVSTSGRITWQFINSTLSTDRDITFNGGSPQFVQVRSLTATRNYDFITDGSTTAGLKIEVSMFGFDTDPFGINIKIGGTTVLNLSNHAAGQFYKVIMLHTGTTWTIWDVSVSNATTLILNGFNP